MKEVIISNLVRFDGLRKTAYGSITTSYVALGTPFTHAMRVLHFVNNTDALIYVSFDGTNDNAVIVPNGFALYDLTSDQDWSEKFRYQNGTQIYIKYVGSAPTAASDGFYLVAVYGKGE